MPPLHLSYIPSDFIYRYASHGTSSLLYIFPFRFLPISVVYIFYYTSCISNQFGNRLEFPSRFSRPSVPRHFRRGSTAIPLRIAFPSTFQPPRVFNSNTEVFFLFCRFFALFFDYECPFVITILAMLFSFLLPHPRRDCLLFGLDYQADANQPTFRSGIDS